MNERQLQPDSAWFVVHLAGAHRGAARPLEGGELQVGTAAGSDLHFPAGREPAVDPTHATLERAADGWLLRSRPARPVYVNGQPTSRRRLQAGDLVQFGNGGPMVRFRRREPGRSHDPLREVLADCVDCARYGSGGRLRRIGRLLRMMIREVLTRTSPVARTAAAAAAALLIALGAAAGTLVLRAFPVGGDAAAGAGKERPGGTAAARAPDSTRRTGALPGPAQPGPADAEGPGRHRLVETTARSVIFIQGAYDLVPPDSVPSPAGEARGSRYTGTGFVVTESGHVLTNRHIAQPWREHPSADRLVRRGYRLRIRKLLGYLPGHEEPFRLNVVAVSDSADVALLRCEEVTSEVEPLPLSEHPVRPGSPVYAFGYPAGVRAVLARSSRRLLDSLRSGSSLGFWELARRLAEAERLTPLVTRGIVGQVAPAAVVYDAPTAEGGSGGPVVDASGEVVAVSRAKLPDFGGSNLGVPVREAKRLLREAGVRPPPDSAGEG